DGAFHAGFSVAGNRAIERDGRANFDIVRHGPLSGLATCDQRDDLLVTEVLDHEVMLKGAGVVHHEGIARREFQFGGRVTEVEGLDLDGAIFTTAAAFVTAAPAA